MGTKKQVLCPLNHADSPYIRGLGFMYLRFTLPPAMMFDWFEPYLDDEEEIDVKAGGGKPMTMGEMIKLMLTRLEWFETRFPRIAVNHEKIIRDKLDERAATARLNHATETAANNSQQVDYEKGKERKEKSYSRSRTRSKSRSRKSRDRDRSRDRRKSRSRSRDRRKSRSRSRDRNRKSHKRDRSRSRSRSRDRHRHKHKKDKSRGGRDYAEESANSKRSPGNTRSTGSPGLEADPDPD